MKGIKVGQTASPDTAMGKDYTLLGKRDAFHVPGVMVASMMEVKPGDPVMFVDSLGQRVIPCPKHPQQRHGIADPFIKTDVIEPGTMFWIFLEPELVEDLVHNFAIKGLRNNTDVNMDTDDDGCRGCYN